MQAKHLRDVGEAGDLKLATHDLHYVDVSRWYWIVLHDVFIVEILPVLAFKQPADQCLAAIDSLRWKTLRLLK